MTYKEMVNEILANPTVSQEVKRDLHCYASSELMARNEYNGFNYITWIKEGGANRFFKEVAEGLIENNYETQNEVRFMGLQGDTFFY